MSSSTKTTTAQSDSSFNKQVELAREALKNFNAISQLNAPGPVKLAMEELVTVTVRPPSSFLIQKLSSFLLTLCSGCP
jgi:hypothetical protein